MKKLLMTVIIALAVLALAPAAKADGSAAGSLSNCTVQGGNVVSLLNDNNNTINVNVYLCVNGNNIRVAGIFWTGGSPALTALGIDQLGWSSGATFVSAVPAGTSPPPGDWANTGAGVMDGFGSFGGTAAEASGRALVGQLWTLSAPPGSDFAVHIRFGGTTSCSGFVSNRQPGSLSDGSGCGTSVPEPGTLTLLGSGLLGLGLAALRRRLL